MKKILFSLILVFGFSFGFNVFADIIPPNSHSLDRCVKIVNLNEFPNLVLFQYVTGPGINNYEAKKIENNTCLNKGYKFNKLDIYSVTKTNFDSIIDLNNLYFKNQGSNGLLQEKPPVYLLISNLETFGGYLNNTNPLIKETIEYSLTQVLPPANTLVPVNTEALYRLYKSKVISEYNNGTPAKTDVFSWGDNAQQPTERHVFNVNLKFSQRSEEVKFLQDRLITLGYLATGNNTGYFGRLTRKALCDFQIAKGIFSSNGGSCGYNFGPLTRARINE